MTHASVSPQGLRSPTTRSPDASPDDLSTHAHRQLIGYLGVLLAPILVTLAIFRPMAELSGWPPLTSISAYYYSGAVVAFVGTLAALAVFLFTYAGYDNEHRWKDRLLGFVAGIAALGVALFPTAAPHPSYVVSWWTPAMRTAHYVSAGVLFLSFILFSVWLFPLSGGTGGPPVPPDTYKPVRNVIYYASGIAMLVSVIWAAIAGRNGQSIFWQETAALTFFAISWLTKGHALRSIRNAPATVAAAVRSVARRQS